MQAEIARLFEKAKFMEEYRERMYMQLEDFIILE